jgi:hypothetical protein
MSCIIWTVCWAAELTARLLSAIELATAASSSIAVDVSAIDADCSEAAFARRVAALCATARRVPELS